MRFSKLCVLAVTAPFASAFFSPFANRHFHLTRKHEPSFDRSQLTMAMEPQYDFNVGDDPLKTPPKTQAKVESEKNSSLPREKARARLADAISEAESEKARLLLEIEAAEAEVAAKAKAVAAAEAQVEAKTKQLESLDAPGFDFSGALGSAPVFIGSVASLAAGRAALSQRAKVLEERKRIEEELLAEMAALDAAEEKRAALEETRNRLAGPLAGAVGLGLAASIFVGSGPTENPPSFRSSTVASISSDDVSSSLTLSSSERAADDSHNKLDPSKDIDVKSGKVRKFLDWSTSPFSSATKDLTRKDAPDGKREEEEPKATSKPVEKPAKGDKALSATEDAKPATAVKAIEELGKGDKESTVMGVVKSEIAEKTEEESIKDDKGFTWFGDVKAGSSAKSVEEPTEGDKGVPVTEDVKSRTLVKSFEGHLKEKKMTPTVDVNNDAPDSTVKVEKKKIAEDFSKADILQTTDEKVQASVDSEEPLDRKSVVSVLKSIMEPEVELEEEKQEDSEESKKPGIMFLVKKAEVSDDKTDTDTRDETAAGSAEVDEGQPTMKISELPGAAKKKSDYPLDKSVDSSFAETKGKLKQSTNIDEKIVVSLETDATSKSEEKATMKDAVEAVVPKADEKALSRQSWREKMRKESRETTAMYEMLVNKLTEARDETETLQKSTQKSVENPMDKLIEFFSEGSKDSLEQKNGEKNVKESDLTVSPAISDVMNQESGTATLAGAAIASVAVVALTGLFEEKGVDSQRDKLPFDSSKEASSGSEDGSAPWMSDVEALAKTTEASEFDGSTAPGSRGEKSYLESITQPTGKIADLSPTSTVPARSDTAGSYLDTLVGSSSPSSNAPKAATFSEAGSSYLKDLSATLPDRVKKAGGNDMAMSSRGSSTTGSYLDAISSSGTILAGSTSPTNSGTPIADSPSIPVRESPAAGSYLDSIARATPTSTPSPAIDSSANGSYSDAIAKPAQTADIFSAASPAGGSYLDALGKDAATLSKTSPKAAFVEPASGGSYLDALSGSTTATARRKKGLKSVTVDVSASVSYLDALAGVRPARPEKAYVVTSDDSSSTDSYVDALGEEAPRGAETFGSKTGSNVVSKRSCGSYLDSL